MHVLAELAEVLPGQVMADIQKVRGNTGARAFRVEFFGVCGSRASRCVLLRAWRALWHL